jgi:protein-S-isoprenylcysteine O-methyltransferase Ste14
MNKGGVFVVGLAVLFVLGVGIGTRLPREYRSALRTSVPTLAMVWAFCGVHFTLVVLAAVWSTWHFRLPAPVAVGGGMTLSALGAALYVSATYVFGFKRQSGLVTTRLVTEGIYRWSRNPIFVGWTLVLAGLGLARGSAMVLFLMLILSLGYGLSLPLEEELLGRLYGDAHDRYRSRTHRYFGPPRPDAGE